MLLRKCSQSILKEYTCSLVFATVNIFAWTWHMASSQQSLTAGWITVKWPVVRPCHRRLLSHSDQAPELAQSEVWVEIKRGCVEEECLSPNHQNHIIHPCSPPQPWHQLYAAPASETKQSINEWWALIDQTVTQGGKYTIILLCDDDTSKWYLLKINYSNTHPSLNLSSFMTFMYSMFRINGNDQ